ncbi:hypothetical protein N8590_04275 [bacterium]|nr:hypothetical protein [bacterium]MDB4439883.1 hypothetical protein [Planctomicrobium sp.]
MNVGGVSQIQLHVKIMEVQRSKIRELGFNFLALGQNYAVASTVGSVSPLTSLTTPFAGPVGAETTIGGSELSFAITGSRNLFNGFLKALQTESLLKVLPEPVLVTTSGRPASMLSGGEFPVLVPQGVGATTVEWREFGVRMEAVPIVLGNGRLRLDIAPEVSSRDVSNSVNVDGLVVPGINVRRVNTQVEMRFGETLMIGGLISTTRTGDIQKVPVLGEIPWIGAAFSRKIFTEGETELLILVTPEMAAPVSAGQCMPPGPGQQSTTPTDTELYLDGLLEVPNYGGPETIIDAPYNQQMIIPGAGPAHQGQQLPPNAAIDSAQNNLRSQSIQQVGGDSASQGENQSAEYQFSSGSNRSSAARPLTSESNPSRQNRMNFATLESDSKSRDLIETSRSK